MTSKNGKKMMNQYFTQGLAGLSMFLLSAWNVLAADLQSIDFSSLGGDKTQIELIFSEAVGTPKSFSIDDPARVVLDFVDVQNKLTQKTQQVNIGATRSVSTVEAGGRTRIVLNLTKTAPYTVSQQGNSVFVIVSGNSSQAATTKVPALKTSDMAAGNKRSITDIDFRRGEQDAGRVILVLSEQGSAIDVHQESNRIVIDMVNMTLPESLHRRLDVVDFGTPVKLIESAQKGRDTQLTISTQGEFEYLSYQTDSNFVVEVKPVSKQDQEAARKAKRGYHGEKLSLNFQDVEVRAVLQILADFTGLNLVTSDSVTGNITLRLKNVPWDQALDIIMKTKGLAKRDNGNVILVAPAADFAISEKQEIEAQKQLIQLEPLYSEIIEVNFAKASDIALLLVGKSAAADGDGSALEQEGGEAFLSIRGSVSVDGRTNSLLLRDTAGRLDLIKDLIVTLDIPVRQVLIESRIVIASDDFTKELGVRFGVTKRKSSDNKYLGDTITSGSLGATTDILNGDTIGFNERMNVNLPVANPAGQVALAFSKLPLGLLLELELSAMQEEGTGEIISSPKVITSNRHKALIEQGTEIPYLEASSSGAATVTFKKAVLKLEVTPQITPDDHIIMDLAVHKDEIGEIFLGIPSIDTRKVLTQVLVDNGETIVLGGVYEQTTLNTSTRVPFFGDLPMVGALFRTNLDDDKKRELLIFITPKIVKQSLKF